MVQVISERSIRGWYQDFMFSVEKDGDYLRLKEMHTIGPVEKDVGCVEVVISLSKMNFTWESKKGTSSSIVYNNFIQLFLEAEDKFISLMGAHLKREFNGEKIGRWDWLAIRRTIKEGLSNYIPEKETERKIFKGDKVWLLRSLKRARSAAERRGIEDRTISIRKGLDKMIREVEGFEQET